MTSTRLRLTLSTGALLVAVPSFAQTLPPDAGQTLREMSRPPTALPHAAPALTVPADADPGADAGQRFAISAVRIEGNRLVDTAELQPLVDGLAGREATLGELRQAARRITALYRERGFVVARSFVPAQAISDGVVTVTVLEGRLQSTTVLNRSIVLQERLDGVVAAQALEGRPIRSAEMDRELLLLSDLPAVGAVSGYLQPGKDVGSSDLFVSVDAGPEREGEVSLDNFGNRYTGQTRLNGRIDFNSPSRSGDRLALRGTVTDRNLVYGRAAYDTPANADGLRVGAAVSSSHYELGREFRSLDASGRADTIGMNARYPLLRGLDANVWLAGSLDHRRLQDRIGSTSTTTDKTATTATVEAYGDVSDALLEQVLGGLITAGGAYGTWHLTGVAGRLHIDTSQARLADAAGPGTQGGYRKLQASVSRLQGLAPGTTLLLTASGQLAAENLDSSEKWVVGGVWGVRAYPQGEGVGDEGWLGSVELRQQLASGVQASAFYDAGGVTYSHAAFTTGRDGVTLRGWGVALAGTWNGFDVKATLAWRDGERAVTAPDHRPRGWMTAGWRF